MLVRILWATLSVVYARVIAFFLKERDNCSSLFDLIQGFFRSLHPWQKAELYCKVTRKKWVSYIIYIFDIGAVRAGWQLPTTR